MGFITWREGKYYRGNLNYSCTVQDHNQLSARYLYYLLNNMQKEIQSLATYDGIPALNKCNLETLKIPIPPIEVQEKIARILGSFTQLESELRMQLKAELAARRKQYHYYRDKLLQFEGQEVKWASIDEIFIIRNGYTPSKANKAFWTNGSIPWFRMEDIRENGRILSKSIQLISENAVRSGKLFPANSILISTSVTIGEHALITVPHLSNQRFSSLSLKSAFADLLNIRFAFYYCFILSKWCLNNKNTSSFSSINMVDFRKLKFPLPSLEVQNRIVSILDKFDALVNDLSIGLPAEIAARRKQYHYYRDKLLAFEEA